MQVYQISPTLVVGVNDEIIKIFDSAEECQKETQRLKFSMTPLVDSCHADEYRLHLVRVISSFDKVLVMERAQGVPLAALKNMDGSVKLVGKYLGKFHQKLFEVNGVSSPKLFGDFSIYHIYVDPKNKVISTIDPGANFMVEGNQLEDVARFLFSAVERFRLKPFTACSVMRSFMEGYMEYAPANSSELSETIRYRKKISQGKNKIFKTPLKAYFGGLFLIYYRCLIWCAIRC